MVRAVSLTLLPGYAGGMEILFLLWGCLWLLFGVLLALPTFTGDLAIDYVAMVASFALGTMSWGLAFILQGLKESRKVAAASAGTLTECLSMLAGIRRGLYDGDNQAG